MNRIAVSALALVFALHGPAWADTFEGHVIHVADGDTITVLNGKEQIRVRIGGIDAPERRQAFSGQSHENLSRLVRQQRVSEAKKWSSYAPAEVQEREPESRQALQQV
jgi:endonuclease YncB( thermonuclease family)